MDYPNSKKARKVFLCLYVGGGGGGQQQVPKGLEGDEEVDGSRAKFETRRERVSKSSKKRKEIKGKEWILRKKEVCAPLERGIQTLININLTAISAPRQRGCSQ